MKVELQTITPEKAKSMLEYNTINRPINYREVAKLAREMKQGRWKAKWEAVALREASINGARICAKGGAK